MTFYQVDDFERLWKTAGFGLREYERAVQADLKNTVRSGLVFHFNSKLFF